MGMLASMFGLASVIGPAVGGFITDLLNWRWVFYVNIPLCVLSMILIFRQLPHIKKKKDSIKIDYLGSITLTFGLIPFLLVFYLGRNTLCMVLTTDTQYATLIIDLLIRIPIY